MDARILGEGRLHALPHRDLMGLTSDILFRSQDSLVQHGLDFDGRLDVREHDGGVAAVVEPDQLHVLLPHDLVAQIPELALAKEEEELSLDDRQAARGASEDVHGLDRVVGREGFAADDVDDEAEARGSAVGALLLQHVDERVGVARKLEDDAAEAGLAVFVMPELNLDEGAFGDRVRDVGQGEILGEVQKEDQSHLLDQRLLTRVDDVGDATHGSEPGAGGDVSVLGVEIDHRGRWVGGAGDVGPRR